MVELFPRLFPLRAFYTGSMPATGPVLALDVGDRRIGLAISDPLRLVARPLFTVQRSTLRADLKAIGRWIRKHEVSALLVGDPVHANGEPSQQSIKTRVFAEALFREHPDLGHHLLDERLTTKQAHHLLDRAGHRTAAGDRLERKLLIDQVAAAVLLQAFLERAAPALLPAPNPEAELPDT